VIRPPPPLLLLLLLAACGAEYVTHYDAPRKKDLAFSVDGEQVENALVATLDENADLAVALARAKATAPAPAAGAWVLATEGDRVLLSVGKREKCREGDTFDLFREGKYVGRVAVTEVDEDSCFAGMKADGRGPAAPPRIGDRAAPVEGRERIDLRSEYARNPLTPAGVLVRALESVHARRQALDKAAPGWSEAEWWFEITARKRFRHPPSGWVVGLAGERLRISLGEAEGLRQWSRLEIRRGDALVGPLVVDEVFAHRAAGDFAIDRAGPAAPPQVGDRVTVVP